MRAWATGAAYASTAREWSTDLDRKHRHKLIRIVTGVGEDVAHGGEGRIGRKAAQGILGEQPQHVGQPGQVVTQDRREVDVPPLRAAVIDDVARPGHARAVRGIGQPTRRR